MFEAKRNQPDLVFLALGAAWLLFGLVMLFSASGPAAVSKFGDAYYYIRHQLVYGVLPGLALFIVALRIDYSRWRKLALPLFVASIVALVAVFVPGAAAEWGTAKSWINLFGFSFQPAELAKVALVLFLARWFDERGDVSTLESGLFPFLAYFGVVAVLLILQPDLGSLLVIGAAAFTLYFLAGAPWTHIAGLAVVAAGAMTVLINTSAYRANRLMTFLHPELDPLGVGYHINQAFLALGSGGLFGLGLGHSRQKFLFLPETVGDSVFAVMGEELGFFVTVLFLALAGAFIWRGLQIARSAPDRFGRLIVGGFIGWIFFQTLFNVGSMVGILPITGLPLPFVSYGGTATMALLVAVGMIANVSSRAKLGKFLSH